MAYTAPSYCNAEAIAMLALTDDQMNIVTKLAEPLLYVDRAGYLRRVAELLRGRELGDGIVYRAAQQAQTEFRRMTVLEDQQLHSGKYAR